MTAFGIEWVPNLLGKGKTLGSFTDAHGKKHLIGEAQWHPGSIYIGTIVLTPEMCAELALILGYIAYTGNLPQPDGIDS